MHAVARKTNSRKRLSGVLSFLGGAVVASAAATAIFVWSNAPTKAAPLRENQPHVTVLAAPELQEPVTLLTREYAKQKNVTVTAYFLPASEYMTPVANGKNADLIITDTPARAKEMKQRGLLDVYSVTNLVRDEIVLARPKDAPPAQTDAPFAERLDIYLSSGKPFIIVSPSETSDLGKHVVKILERAATEAKHSADDETIPDILRVDDPTEAADILAKTEDGAALLYRSEVTRNKKLKEEATTPAGYYSPAILQTAVVAGTNMEQARELNAFLQEPEQLAVFYRYGYRSVR